MVSEIQNNQDKNSLLFIMASISPLVQESINLELYRSKADSDGSTEEYILEDSFTRLLQDLEIIGLTFNIDMSDYVDDMGKLSLFVQLAQLLLPNSLYDVIKTDTQIRSLIDHILKGSLGSENSVIQTYLSELGGLDGNLPIRPALADFIDQLYPLVTQTEVFSDYLTNLFNLHEDERPALIVDDERHAQYRAVLRDKIGLLSDAVNLFETWDGFPKLMSAMNFIIRDLIAPDNFTDYAYLLLENKDTLPEELHQGYLDKWRHYYVSHPWCFSYYKVRGEGEGILPIPWEYRTLIACFTYAMGATTKEAYKAGVADLRRYYPVDEQTDAIIAPLLQE